MEEAKLYSLKQIGIACFFGTPVASLFMIAANYRAVGDSYKSKFTYIAAFVLLPFLAFFLPQLTEKNIYRLLIFIVSVFMACLADRLQGDLYKDHIARGGSINTAWRAIKVIVASDLIIIFTTVFYFLIFKHN